MIKIKKTKKFGRGIYATQDILPNQVVEISELIPIPKIKEDKLLLQTKLKYYLYNFEKGSAIALGVGSLFNHSENPNVEWVLKEKQAQIIFKSSQLIKKGEQLFINYGYDL